MAAPTLISSANVCSRQPENEENAKDFSLITCASKARESPLPCGPFSCHCNSPSVQQGSGGGQCAVPFRHEQKKLWGERRGLRHHRCADTDGGAPCPSPTTCPNRSSLSTRIARIMHDGARPADFVIVRQGLKG